MNNLMARHPWTIGLASGVLQCAVAAGVAFLLFGFAAGWFF